MLDILRRVFEFRDWSQAHPTEPPPGDMLDASFDAVDAKIQAILDIVSALQRSDGALSNGIVTWDSFSPDLKAKIVSEVALRAADFANRAESAASEAESARISAKNSEIQALEAADQADEAKIQVSGDKTALLEQVQSLISGYEQGLKALKDAETSLLEVRTDFDDGGALAEAWARSSQLWAEHMPDTLPDNAVKIMDITGDHWSSRWWANRADNAFGRMTDLYLGAWHDPPTQNLEGGPIQVGAIYYDLDDNQMYVWDGSSWQPMWAPQRSAVARLYYVATAGQTSFPLTVADVNGQSYTLSTTLPEGVDTYVNGIKLVQDLGGTTGDYVVTASTSTVTLNRALRAGDMVAFDILMNPSKLSPITARITKLKALTGINGTQTTFALVQQDNSAATPGSSEALLVSLDGVIQEPVTAYSVSGSNITFATAPAADSLVFISWFKGS